jgi:hypothetical protein
MRRFFVSVAALGVLGAVMGCSIVGHGLDCDCCGSDSCGCGASDGGPVPPPLAPPPPPAKLNGPTSPGGTKDMPKLSESQENKDDLGFPQRLTPEADGLELR